MQTEVTVTLYAPFRDLVGCRQVRLPAALPLPAGALLRLLGERFPKLAPYVSATGEGGAAVMLIVNDRMAGPEDLIRQALSHKEKGYKAFKFRPGAGFGALGIRIADFIP